MKTLNTLIATALTLAALASGANAQQQMNTPMTQQPVVATAIAPHATNVHEGVMSMDEVKSITQFSLREQISTSLESITASQVGQLLGSSFDKIASGSTVGFATPLANNGRSVTEQHTVSVSASYEPRPVGGILNVRVEVVPVFSGIGAASRPVAVREFAEAVDNFDQDALDQIIAKLSHELAIEYAAK